MSRRTELPISPAGKEVVSDLPADSRLHAMHLRRFADGVGPPIGGAFLRLSTGQP